MKIGKISESVRKRSILKYIQTNREEVKKGAGLYSDCAFFQLDQEQERILSAMQTVSLPVPEAGAAAVYAAANSIASSGGEPFGILLALTLPKAMEEKELQSLMKSIEKVCSLLQLQIMGGHTEVTESVNSPVISVTAFGKETVPWIENLDQRKKATEYDIVMTKWIGIEGTWILARAKEEELLKRYPYPLIRKAQGLEKELPLQKEAELAYEQGAYLVHDFRNGGVFGGLWELAGLLEKGICVDLKKIPIRQETIEISEFFSINPYELLSGGSLLIATENGQALIEKMEEAGVLAEIIGHTLENNDKIIVNDEETRYLERTKADTIYQIKF